MTRLPAIAASVTALVVVARAPRPVAVVLVATWLLIFQAALLWAVVVEDEEVAS